MVLGLLIAISGATGALTALKLAGWPLWRGVGGGVVTVALGIWLLVAALTERWPRWLARLLGDTDAV